MDHRAPSASAPAIVFVIATYPPYIGGAELQAHRVARLLTRHFRVHVITSRHPGSRTAECSDGVDIRRVADPEGSGLLSAMRNAFSLVIVGLRTPRPAVVQGFQLNGTTFAAAGLARIRGVPLVIKLTGRINIEQAQSVRHRLQLAVLFKVSSALVAPSQGLLILAAQAGAPGKRLRYIPNGVDTEHFHPPAADQRRSLKANLGFDPDDFVFLWIGRLDPMKRVDRVLNVWSAVRQLQPSARLLIVGDGDDRPRVEAAVDQSSGSIRHVPFQQDVLPYYQAADALVLTTDGEGLSNVLLEAMSCGLQCVVSDAPENLEVGTGTDVLLGFDRHTGDGLVEALLRATDRAALREQLAARARARVEDRYGLEVTASEWANLYRSLGAVGAEAGR